MHFTDLFIKRPILSVVVSILILLVGVSAMSSVQTRQYPKMESATITVDTALPGATQDMIQGFVTAPIAQAISTASGIEYITSTSKQGKSHIAAKLVLNANADRSMTEILSKIQTVKYQLPKGVTDPVISKSTDGASAIQYVAFVSNTLEPQQIVDFVTRVAQPLITSVPGVASAQVDGGAAYAMRIWVDPMKLAAHNLTASDLVNVLTSNNIQAAPGQLKGENTVINITAGTDLRNVNSFRNMVIKNGTNGVVHLSDVATVGLGAKNYDSAAIANGKQAVFVSITPTSDANPLTIVSDVNKLLPNIERLAPPGLIVQNQFDVAHFVNVSIDEVKHTLVEAVIIVIAVIFIFLGTFRAVIIPVVTIPLSLLGTIALILVCGFSLNLLTLLAMVLAIGLVVDDAIVVVENIHRHIEEGLTPFKAALVGSREIISPVISMTITLAAVYMPIGLMGGLTGALFREFAFTLAGSVVVSGVIALTLSPMMSSKLLSAKKNESFLERVVERYMTGLSKGYAFLLDKTLAARGAVLLASVIILAGIVMLFSGSQKELAPQEDMGYIFAQTKGPQYANLDYTKRYSAQVERIFAQEPEFSGSFFAVGGDNQNTGFGGIILKDWQKRQRTADQIQQELAGKTGAVTGVYTSLFQPSPLPAGSGGLPLQMVIRSSDDFSSLYGTLMSLKQSAWQSGLFAFVDSDLAFDSTEAHIHVDREKASNMGISMSQIADTLAILVGENYINRFNWLDRSYDVITQAPEKQRLTPASLGNYYVRTGSGKLVPLSTVVNITVKPQANMLPQFNQMNSATLSAVLMPGVTMGQAVNFLRSQHLPTGTSMDWLSSSRQFVKEGNKLIASFMFAMIIIFLVLAAQFESFRDPLVILVTVPLAVCGALTPIYLGYTTLNIYTQIGLVTLIGLISKHGILMVSFANELQVKQGLSKLNAIRQAAVVRMRPVLMTTAAMIAGLFPLIFAFGAGSASRFAIGIVVITGMLVGTLFTLFVLPTFYYLLVGNHKIRESHEDAI